MPYSETTLLERLVAGVPEDAPVGRRLRSDAGFLAIPLVDKHGVEAVLGKEPTPA